MSTPPAATPLTELQQALISLRSAPLPDDAELRGQVAALTATTELRIQASLRIAELLQQLELQANLLEERLDP